MSYICVDRGSDKCPCILMEAGQCYNCGMIQKGKCDCQNQWQGICPYTEYHQRNKTVVERCDIRGFRICEMRSFSPTLSVICLTVPLGYGLKCHQWGAFVMAKWKEWFVPLSVLNVEYDYGNQQAVLELAINAAGPKTIGLLRDHLIGDKLFLKGPFYSGLINREKIDNYGLNIVVVKGIAMMPLINMKDKIGAGLLSFRLDKKKLPEEFIKKYMEDMEYEEIDLEKELSSVAKSVIDDYEYCLNSTEQSPNVFVMTSPYFAEAFVEKTAFDKKDIILPNHSNMCCGEGYCGSCSFSDQEGVTVRMCKCVD